MPQLFVRQKRPKTNIYLGRETITLKNKITTITIYDDTYFPPPVPYVDAGLYNQESPIVDAGLYNTTSWEIVWDGESV
jgi:hypothetical protein